MQELKIELYKGPIDPAFRSLPGYTDIKENMYWAVLMATPPVGSDMANWIKAEAPSPVYPEGTNGTDTLQVGTTVFYISAVCVKHPKYPPYLYYPQVPNGPILGPIPIGHGDGGYYCVTPPPNTNGMGIWLVTLEPFSSTSPEPLPVAPTGGRAVFHPSGLELINQPLLIIRGEIKGEKVCPDLQDITVDKNCFSSDETGTFTVAITDPDSALCGYTWEFENIDTGQTETISSSINSVTVTFDNTWSVGNWEVKVSAIICGASPDCGFSIIADNSFEFGLLETECPVIEYLDANPDVNNSCIYLFEVSISGDYTGTRLVWGFGDGTSPVEQDVTGTVMTIEHAYSNVPANGAHVSVELVGMNVCCSQQSKERWISLPEEGCGAPPAITYNCVRGRCIEVTGGTGQYATREQCQAVCRDGGPPDNDEGGFSLCCSLLGLWALAFIAAGFLAYFNLWQAAGIAYLGYGFFLAIWIGVCCWPCARRFWKCCTLLQWHLIATAWLLQGFAVLALVGITNPAVTAFYILFEGSVLGAMLAIGRCRVPNIWKPSDYPSCKCLKSWW